MLDKAIEHGKEKRKPYRGGKAICRSCRNHGSCEWCKSNRLYKYQKRGDFMFDEIYDFIYGCVKETEEKNSK